MSWPTKQLTEIFSRTADGVLVSDREQKVVFWNQAAEQLLGYLSDEVLGRQLLLGIDQSLYPSGEGHPISLKSCWGLRSRAKF